MKSHSTGIVVGAGSVSDCNSFSFSKNSAHGDWARATEAGRAACITHRRRAAESFDTVCASMNARDVVTAHIAGQARRFPELDLAPMDTAGLDARDAALAGAIEHAVVKRWLTLAAVIESQLSRPWDELEEKMQAALLVGAAQLLLLDRLPDHAVINETVEWAKKNVRSKAGGLVNAVLRKIAALRVERKTLSAPLSRTAMPLHDGSAWELAAPVFDEHPWRRIAQQTSHPESFISHWMKSFGEKKTIEMALHSLADAPILMHSVHGDDERFEVFHGDRAQLLQFLRERPTAIVQDPTSAAPVRATAGIDPKPELIIDSCAGRGTKTRQLGAMHPQARIIATDIDARRLESLQSSLSNHDNVNVIEHGRLMEFAGQADLIVLDVPCSNTGVLARRVEAKYRFNSATLEKIVNLQRQIIADSIPLLKANGQILYSTCSIETAENQQQMQWLRTWHAFEMNHERFTLPAGGPGVEPAKYHDGGYFALMRRISKP